MREDVASIKDRIQILEISALKPYEFNNRKHPEDQVRRIAKSIQEFGFDQPIVVDSKGEIIIGHGRWMAAKYLGLDKVPVLQVDGLTEQQIRARRILDNKLQNDSSWDFDNLNLELDWLEDSGFDFEPWALNDLRFDGEDDAEITEDEAPEAQDKAKFIKLGDIIELGPHKVICGDSTKVSMHEEFENIDVVLTDTPYAIGEAYDSINDDIGTLRNLIDRVINPLISTVERVALTSGVNNLFHFPKPNWIMAWINEAGTGRSPWGFCCWQPLLCYGADPYLKTGQGSRPDIFRGNVASEKNGHPCPKPLSVWAEMLKRVSLPGERVLDPFLGSGTTLIAADQLGRICYGVEISPQYCEVIIKRWIKYCEGKSKNTEIKINGERIEAVQFTT